MVLLLFMMLQNGCKSHQAANAYDDSSDNHENFVNAIGFVHLRSIALLLRRHVSFLFLSLFLFHRFISFVLGRQSCSACCDRIKLLEKKNNNNCTQFNNNDLHCMAIMNVQSWHQLNVDAIFSFRNITFNFAPSFFLSFHTSLIFNRTICVKFFPHFFFHSVSTYFLFSTACLVSFATETVMQICHGRRRCNISADTQTFGNPCRPDSRMYLKTVYTCGECDSFFVLPSTMN